MRPTTYNTLEARNNLSKLIDAALAGEDVVIARRGKPVIRLMKITEDDEVVETPGNPAWIREWFEQNPVNPKWAMTAEEADAYLAEERDSWD